MPLAKPSSGKPTAAKPAVVTAPIVKSTAAESPAPKPLAAKPLASTPSKTAVSAKPVIEKPANVAAVSKPAPAPVAPPKEIAPVIAAKKEPAVDAKKLSTPKEHSVKAESLSPPAPAPVIKTAPVLEPVLVEAPVPLKTVASIPPAPVSKMVKIMAQSSMPFKGYEDMAAFNKANIDAVIQANQILAKGFEDFSKEVMSISKSSVESATSAAKAMFAVRSLKEMMELNTEHTKSMFDKFMFNSTKLSEMSVKVATDAMSPVTARMQLAVEKAIKPSVAA